MKLKNFHVEFDTVAQLVKLYIPLSNQKKKKKECKVGAGHLMY